MADRLTDLRVKDGDGSRVGSDGGISGVGHQDAAVSARICNAPIRSQSSIITRKPWRLLFVGRGRFRAFHQRAKSFDDRPRFHEILKMTLPPERQIRLELGQLDQELLVSSLEPFVLRGETFDFVHF